MRDTRGFVENIDLSVQYILGLLEGIESGSCWTCFDLVEARGKVCG